MNKAVWTLNVDHYTPEITALTHPFLRKYADKIGAEFRVINERHWPAYDVMYEKLQLHEAGKQYDWNLYIDSDAVVHPDMMDMTEVLSKDTVLHNGVDYAACRYDYDQYFRRDGRHIAACNWFTVVSDWCLDLWRPLDDLSYEEAISRIHPIRLEDKTNIPARHLIDDFVISRNIARFGLKHTTFREMLRKIGLQDSGFLWHEYLLTNEQKLKMIKQVVEAWG